MTMLKKAQLRILKRANYEVQSPNLAIALVFFLALCLSSIAFYFGADAAWRDAQDDAVGQLRERILLDIDYIGLDDPLLNTPENSNRKQHYIQRLNEQLAEQSYPITVVDISSQKTAQIEPQQVQETLARSNTSPVFIILELAPMKVSFALSVLPFFFAFILSALLWPWYKKREAIREQEAEPLEGSAEVTKLIINLNDKTLAFGEQGKAVALANKPLCFYLALIEYSVEFPDNTLNQNKEMPAELVELSHKYFARLVALGHTIRKRPNFNNSIEKTLSEIRAVLDEVFEHFADEKDPFFPPKAHGEGSRSRVHHYGLGVRNYEMIEVIGK